MEKSMDDSKTDTKELRKFAITLFCALGIIGGLLLWRKGELGFLFWVIGLVLLLVGLIKPGHLGPIHRGWMRLTHLMGSFMTHLILALMYYFVFTPVGLLIKILRHDPLRLKQEQTAKSYWIKRPQTEMTKSRYESSFYKKPNILSKLFIAAEFWQFLKVRKKYWLAPIVLMFLLFGALILLTEGSALAPFIYALF